MEDEEAARKKLEEVEERKKMALEGEREFRKGADILGKEERELKKGMELREKMEGHERKAGALDRQWERLFGKASERDPIVTYAIYAVAIILILVAGIYIRTTLTRYWGFYEPDDFYHFSVLRAAVNNNFFIPSNLSISGWPVSTVISEPKGLYWVTLLPYFFLRFVGISYYTIMRYISVVFGLLDILGAYMLARLLSKDKFFLLLVIALVALSSGDAARTSALIYRGDSFVTFFLIAALVFFAYVFRVKSGKSKIIFAVLSGLALALTNFVWNGSPFVTIVYLLSALVVLVVSFVNKREEMLNDSVYILLALVVWFIGVNALIAGGQILPGSQILTGPEFIPVFAFLAVGWLIARHINRKNYIPSQLGRLGLIVLVVILGVVGISLAAPSLISRIVLNNGLIVTTAFDSTIQELTPPTYNFLFASFGYALYTSPMAVIMVLPAVLLHGIAAVSVLRTELDLAFWILLMVGFMPYLFMRVYDSGGFLKGNARVRLGVDVGMIILIIYFATTAFLQIYAIRFNSLVAVPLAIFGAYTIYWLTLASRKLEITKAAGPAAVFLCILAILAVAVGGVLGVLAGFVVGILAAGAVYLLADYSGRYEIVGYAITIILIVALLYYDLVFSAGVSPADSMNPSLYAAMGWLKNNSANSSVVLTLWPDGSVVEGVANRTSVMDSVGSQSSEKSFLFAQWLFNSSDDPQFLTGSAISRPDYLVVRYVWLYGETVGIFQESGLNASTEDSYAYAPLTSYNENANSTTEVFRFTNGQSTGAINAVVEISSNNSMESYIDNGNGQISPFSYVAFDDQSTGNFSVVRQTAFNATNNQLLLIQYSEVPNPELRVNVTNAVIFAPGMAQSNLLKFLYFCNDYECEWNNNMASLQLVYANQDTKIFRISYNGTS